MPDRIRIAIIGVGNCASSLTQGIHYYRGIKERDAVGLMHWEIGGYKPGDIEIVAAFDVDHRKVGLDINSAIFCKPNCTTIFHEDIAPSGKLVHMGRILDGCSAHMNDYDEDRTFLVSKNPEPTQEAIVAILKSQNVEVMLNYLPVGSEMATRFYAECALEAGVAFVNNIPVFIASDPLWAKRFQEKNLPLIGDDIKSQLGATITHRTLVDLFRKRGVRLERTYQLNTGGNTDFLNMLNMTRLAHKKTSKTEAVQAVASPRLEVSNIHVGPSDYIPWQKDNKVCFVRMEGKIFGNASINLEMRLSVEDSPNSAGVVIDAIRCAKLAMMRNQGGVQIPPSAYLYKHPLVNYSDDEAYTMLNEYIATNTR